VVQLTCLIKLQVQEKYPALTGIISFSDLKGKTIPKKLEWTNPDGSREQMEILEMAIPFDDKMKALTRQFVHSVYGLDSIILKPKMIVFHAMGDGDLKTSLEVSSFLNDQIPDSWGDLSKAGKLPNGAHFIIDRNGTVICLSPPLSKNNTQVSYDRKNHQWYIKRHQDGNPVAIGIENVTDKNNYVDLTDEQLVNNAKLARWLIWFEQGQIQFLTSHHQFNDDRVYDQFLKDFHLQNLQKQFRTRGRKDVGQKNLLEILNRANNFGIVAKLYFQ